MGNKVKRPISVWIAQALFVYSVLMIVLGFFLAMMATQPSERSFDGFLFTAIMSVVLIALYVTAFGGMATRKPYGRWLGVGMLSFMLILTNVSKVLFPPNSIEPIAAIVIRVLFSIFVFVVTLHIALSDKVGAFFARKIELPPLDHPPSTALIRRLIL